MMEKIEDHKAVEEEDSGEDESVELRQTAESRRSPKSWVENPLPTDVICGRGAKITHPGNQTFRNLIMARKWDYQRANRREDKTRITLEIVNLLTNGTGARFLLKDTESDKWFDVGIEYGKDKTSHALRSRPNSRKAKSKRGSASKRSCPPELEDTVSRLICDQQQLLEIMVRREVLPLAPGAP